MKQVFECGCEMGFQEMPKDGTMIKGVPFTVCSYHLKKLRGNVEVIYLK